MTARKIGRTAFLGAALVSVTALGASAQAQQVDKNFYKGKTINYVVATAAGGPLVPKASFSSCHGLESPASSAPAALPAARATSGGTQVDRQRSSFEPLW